MYALLQAGGDPSALAKQFATRLSQPAEIIWEQAALFVNDCFGAINLNLRINAEDLQRDLDNFAWPQVVIQRYLFDYDATKFQQMEEYLYCILVEINSLTAEFQTLPIQERERARSPLAGFVQVLLAWLSTSGKLKEQDNSALLVEPIARLDFRLLSCLHLECHAYQDAYPVLKTICGRLFVSATLGIRYPRTYADLNMELLTLLQDYFHFYLPQLNTNGNFYEIALKVVKAQGNHKKVFKSFAILLDKYCMDFEQQNNQNIDNQERQHSLDVSNFFIRTNMLCAYYFYLKNERNKLTLKYLLEFLLKLQSKLIEVNCFEDSFMWTTLSLVFNEDEIVADYAANFFTIIMKQRHEYNELCEEVIAFYFREIDEDSPLSLQQYVRYIWKYLGVGENHNHFLAMITVSEQMRRIQAANFLNEIIRYLCEDYATNRSKIRQLVQGIVRELESINCLYTESVLLLVVGVIEEAYVKFNDQQLKALLKRFERTAEKKFVVLEDLQYPLRKQYFEIFKNIASKYTENDDQIQATCHSVKIECILLLTDAENRFEQLSESELSKISCALQNLNLITQMKFCECEEAAVICELLKRNLFGEIDSQELSVFHEMANEHKMLLDAYALELYVGCLVIMFASPAYRDVVMESTLGLEEYLKNWLSNAEQLPHQPIVRIKTYFNCMLGLSIAFSSYFDFMNLSTSTYGMLVRTLEWILFKKKNTPKDYKEFTEFQPLRQLNYQKTMLSFLIELHKTATVHITNDIWHVCFHFSSSTKGKAFDTHLRELMTVLAERHHQIFRHIIPVIIFNFFTPQSNMSTQTIKSSIKAHKNFISNLNHPRRQLLCFSIVLEVISKLKRVLELGTRTGSDRMAPLKYLHIILSDLKIPQIVKEDLKMQASSLEIFADGAEERPLIQEFLDFLENAGA